MLFPGWRFGIAFGHCCALVFGNVIRGGSWRKAFLIVSIQTMRRGLPPLAPGGSNSTAPSLTVSSVISDPDDRTPPRESLTLLGRVHEEDSFRRSVEFQERPMSMLFATLILFSIVAIGFHRMITGARETPEEVAQDGVLVVFWVNAIYGVLNLRDSTKFVLDVYRASDSDCVCMFIVIGRTVRRPGVTRLSPRICRVRGVDRVCLRCPRLERWDSVGD